jgi:Kef-type K+ transport system membrane component KefB
MQLESQFLIAVGGILLLGLITDALGKKTFLPRVTLLLMFGLIIGDAMLGIIPDIVSAQFEIVADMALLMVGFLIGGKLTVDSLKDSAGQIFWISITTAIVTALIVTAILTGLGVEPGVSILLGCIASATAPAAIFDVVAESDYKGPFGGLLLSVVALDDAWALLLFAMGVAIVAAMNGGDVSVVSPLYTITREIGGAVLLGLVIGFPAAYLTGRIRPGQPMLIEALGLVFLCGGLAIMLEVSFLISAMVLGAVIANFARHHEYPFHAIEGIEWPFMVIFFVLAGASLELGALKELSMLGVIYILSRIAGKYIGSMIGCSISGVGSQVKQWMGAALLPQAGVAIGMALVASEHFPDYAQILLTIVISSTIFFEVIGPVFTRIALSKVRAK